MSEIAYIQKVKSDSYEMEVYIDPINKRLRIDDYRGNVEAIITRAEEIAVSLQKEKFIFIARQEHFHILIQHGFQCEAKVDGLFRGSDAYYFSKYYQEERRISKDWLMEDGIVQAAKNTTVSEIKIPKTYQLKKMEKRDAIHLSRLYQQVFKVYPTPLNDPEYIKKTIDDWNNLLWFFIPWRISKLCGGRTKLFLLSCRVNGLCNASSTPEIRFNEKSPANIRR